MRYHYNNNEWLRHYTLPRILQQTQNSSARAYETFYVSLIRCTSFHLRFFFKLLNFSSRAPYETSLAPFLAGVTISVAVVAFFTIIVMLWSSKIFQLRTNLKGLAEFCFYNITSLLKFDTALDRLLRFTSSEAVFRAHGNFTSKKSRKTLREVLLKTKFSQQVLHLNSLNLSFNFRDSE